MIRLSVETVRLANRVTHGNQCMRTTDPGHPGERKSTEDDGTMGKDDSTKKRRQSVNE